MVSRKDGSGVNVGDNVLSAEEISLIELENPDDVIAGENLSN